MDDKEAVRILSVNRGSAGGWQLRRGELERRWGRRKVEPESIQEHRGAHDAETVTKGDGGIPLESELRAIYRQEWADGNMDVEEALLALPLSEEEIATFDDLTVGITQGQEVRIIREMKLTGCTAQQAWVRLRIRDSQEDVEERSGR